MTEAEIVELYRKRDEEALRVTQEQYEHYLMKIAMQILNDEEDAKECVNDTYLAAWNSIPDNKPERLSLYLGKIVRAKAVDRVRYNTSEKRRASEYTVSMEELEEVFSDDRSPEDELDAAALRDAVKGFLLKQPAEDRKLFLERYFYFRPLKEAAEQCGMSEPKAKSILFRMRKKLKAHLKKEGFTR